MSASGFAHIFGLLSSANAVNVASAFDKSCLVHLGEYEVFMNEKVFGPNQVPHARALPHLCEQPCEDAL